MGAGVHACPAAGASPLTAGPQQHQPTQHPRPPGLPTRPRVPHGPQPHPTPWGRDSWQAPWTNGLATPSLGPCRSGGTDCLPRQQWRPHPSWLLGTPNATSEALGFLWVGGCGDPRTDGQVSAWSPREAVRVQGPPGNGREQGGPPRAALSFLFPPARPPERAVLVVTGLPWQGLRANLSCCLLCKTGASHPLWCYRRCMHEVQSVCMWRA